MISVVVPLYNKRKTVARCIESILNQSYKDLEIIVVDDESVDGSLDVIASIAKQSRDRHGLRPRDDSRVKIISGLGHFGANWARNYGAHLAQGDYLFFCDADIFLKKDVLQKMLTALEKNKDDAYTYSSFKLGWKKMWSRPFDAEAIKKQNYISTMSLIRRADFSGFDENLKKFQDWDLWLTMLTQGKTGIFINEILFYAKPDRGMSRWLPKFFYKLPWLQEVKKYNEARDIIIKKHKL